jgi:hypothetical protein
VIASAVCYFMSSVENINFFKRIGRSCLYFIDKLCWVKVMKHLKYLVTLTLSALALTACSQAEMVSESECDKVVAHAKSILKENAPSKADMLKQCKAASDEARGCVMASDKPMKLLQCDF